MNLGLWLAMCWLEFRPKPEPVPCIVQCAPNDVVMGLTSPGFSSCVCGRVAEVHPVPVRRAVEPCPGVSMLGRCFGHVSCDAAKDMLNDEQWRVVVEDNPQCAITLSGVNP